MKESGTSAIFKKKYRATTDSKHTLPVVQNYLNRNFEIDQHNQPWLADISYIYTGSLTLPFHYHRPVFPQNCGVISKTRDNLILSEGGITHGHQAEKAREGVAFAPLSKTIFEPDLIILYCDPAQLA